MKSSFTTKPIKSHKSAPVKRQRRKPEWDSTIHDLNSYKLSPEELKRRREAFLSKNKTEDENNPPYSPHPQGSHEWPSSAPSETENVASPATKFELIRYKPTISPKVSDSLQSSLQKSTLSNATARPKTSKLESQHQPLIPKCNEVDLETEISCFERKSKLASGSSNLAVSKSRPRMSTSTGSVKSKSSKPKMNKPYNTSQSYEIPIEEMRRLVRATIHLQNALCGLDESFGVTEEWINEDMKPVDTFKECIDSLTTMTAGIARKFGEIDRQLKHYHQTKLDLEQKLSNCQSQIEELKKSTQSLTALQTESAKAINQYQSLFQTVISDIQIKQEQLLEDREHDILNELLDRACDGSQGKGRRVAGISNANRFEGKENNSAKGQPNLNKRHSVAREAEESKDFSNVAPLCHPVQKLAQARQHLLRPTHLNNPTENFNYTNKLVNPGTENEKPSGDVGKMKQSAHENYAYSGIVPRLQKMDMTDDVFN